MVYAAKLSKTLKETFFIWVGETTWSLENFLKKNKKIIIRELKNIGISFWLIDDVKYYR